MVSARVVERGFHRPRERILMPPSASRLARMLQMLVHLLRFMRPYPFPSLVRTVWLAIAGSVLVVTCAGAVPARLRFEQLSTEQGLPQQSVLSVLQDRHGFMWFATQGGVARFDGYRTTVFRHDREDPSSLSANRVWRIFEDRQGTLWLGTAEGGLNRFDAASESFRAYRHDPANPSSIPNDRIWDLYQDRRGAMWVATSGGLTRFDPAAGTFTRQEIGPGSQETVRAILDGPSDHLWVGTSRRGLVRLDPATGPVDVFRHDPSDPRSLPDDRVLALHRGRAGTLWVGTSGGLARLDEATGAMRVFRHDPTDPRSLAGVQAQAILEDRAGNLWIGTNGGLSVLDRATGSFANFRHDPSQVESLPNDSMAAVHQDRSGILWFGTWYGGVARLNPQTWQTVSYYRGSDRLRSPPGGVLSLHEDGQDRLWLGTTEGLTHFDLRSGAFSVPGQADERDITGIAEDGEGNTWVVLREGELELWESPAGRSREVSLNPSDSRRFVTAVYRDPAGVVWIGHGGLVRLGPESRLTRYTHHPDDPASLAPSGVKSLATGRDGSLWIGYSDRGLSRLAPGVEHFEHFRLYAETEGQPSVSAIHEDETGRIWVATNAGLFRLSPLGTSDGDRAPKKAFTVKAYTVREGLASDLLAAILPDSEGRLWLSTAAGITRFEPETEIFRNVSAAEGARAGGYNKGAALRLRDGRMVFGGSDGMTIFRAEEIYEDSSPPLLALTDLRLFNRSVPVTPGESGILDRPIHLTEEIVLGPADDVVSFELTALHFANPRANRYSYKLEGFDREWIPTDASHRIATYTDLPPGSYSLRVRGSNHDQVWNQEGITLRVQVLPPWWRTWWAYMLYVLAFGGLICGLIFANRRLEALVVARTAEVREQARRVQEEHDAKARFIANVSHEFRTPLTLAIGPLEELRSDPQSGLSPGGRKSLDVALRNSRRMMGLVGQVLDAGRLETGRTRLRLTESDLVEVIRLECSCFRVEARQRGVTLETELPDRPVSLVFDLDSMEKVVSNLLSNAVKFTPEGGSVRVRLEQTERAVILEVSDTGMGIAGDELPRVFERYFQGSRTIAGRPGTGIGLAIVKDLVELHGGRVEAWSQPGEGSILTVTLPRGCEHFDPGDLRSLGTSRFEDAPEPPLEISANEPDRVEDEQRETVLIVDDNPELRSFLTLRLSAGYRVLQAGDGEQALGVARQELPDLIVSDVMMPSLDGLAMTRKLRRDPEIGYIPVLLLTARATTRDTVEGLQSGADDYLTKPFESSELVARIAGLLASRRRLGEHLRRQPSSEPPRSETFEQRLRRTIVDNLHDSTFTVRDLASALAIDRTVLFRKVKDSFGATPSELISRLRRDRAAGLLRARGGSATGVG